MIVSNALRKSAGHPDARCMLNIAGVCIGERGGCVLCHIRVAGEVGGGQKPHDLGSAAFGCSACHDVLDGRVRGLENGSRDWNFYALRAVMRTLAWWHDKGFIAINGQR